MKFNDKMLRLRDERKMSQEELSEASGISVRTIQRIEKGQVTPRPYTARKLLEALAISLEEFNADAYDNSRDSTEENTRLNRFMISNFLIFILPILYLVFLIAIWKKGKWSNTSNVICKKVLSFQIIWTILSVTITLLTPLFITLFGGQYVIGQLFPTPILVYLCLSFISIFIVFKIVKSLKNPYSKWISMIPDLF